MDSPESTVSVTPDVFITTEEFVDDLNELNETPEQTLLRQQKKRWAEEDRRRAEAEAKAKAQEEAKAAAEAQGGKPGMAATTAAVVPQDDVYDSDAFMPVGDFRNQLASQHGGTDCNIWTKIKRKNPWIRFDLQAPTSRPRIHRADAAKLLDRLDVNTWELLDEGEHPSIAGEALDEQIADAIATRRAIREVKRRKGG
jgi:hypothetical protein